MKTTQIPLDTLEDVIDVLNKAFDAEGDTFGLLHNTAVDVLIALERLFGEARKAS